MFLQRYCKTVFIYAIKLLVAPDSKSGDGEIYPEVRIPPLPPFFLLASPKAPKRRDAPVLVSWCEASHSESKVMLSSWFLVSQKIF